MTQNQAERLAALLDEIHDTDGAHEAWNSGGNIWLVSVHRDSAGDALPSAMIVYSGDCIAEYAGDAEFEDGKARSVIEVCNLIK